ncbi:MAG: hypothetical protein HY695_07725 [Deltaproteobacteria bacterium]|nr:hypothetical protein [Deltaproteobacteria bacterium]
MSLRLMIAVAFGSYVVGVAHSLLFFGTAGSPIARQVASAAQLVVIDGAEPVVPPLKGTRLKDVKERNIVQQLDGFICENCVFEDAKFTYAGGPLLLKQVSVKNWSIEFKGAALNTLTLVKSLHRQPLPKNFPRAVPENPVWQIKNAPRGAVDLIIPN